MLIQVYPLQHFMQWGTPDDLKEYQSWSNIFKNIKKIFTNNDIFFSIFIIPMAGKGKRFSDKGYKEPKPLINVQNKPIIYYVLKSFPSSTLYSMLINSSINKNLSSLKNFLPIKDIIFDNVNNITSGQATSTKIALDNVLKYKKSKKFNKMPIHVSSCDGLVIFEKEILKKTLEVDADLIIWTAKANFSAKLNPEMYGWVKISKENTITKAFVKEMPSNGVNNIIIGSFTFKNSEIFYFLYNEMVKKDIRVNNEYYLDSMINIAIDNNLKCIPFNVDYFVSLGTPDELETFNYWLSCFSKWKFHPFKNFDFEIFKDYDFTNNDILFYEEFNNATELY